MRKLILVLFVLCSALSMQAQRPKLIVGIVVDQMRADYLTRYWDKLGDDGFKRLLKEGFQCKNAHFNYIPTYTAPGHASIYTGTTPSVHGIIGNAWYDREAEDFVYCVEDSTVNPTGSENNKIKMSPHRLLSPTLGDAVGIGTLFRGKVVGMSIKDRGAILPVGHSAGSAYWLDYESGNFVSSDYYLEDLPSWVNEFNAARKIDAYVEQGWNTLLPIKEYTESTKDDTPYEASITGTAKPVFPYALKEAVKKKNYKVLASTPHGNTLLRELAESAIRGDDLGKDEVTDLLAISFSSTDMIGHEYGPQSIEVEDTYLRLDREIAALLKTLDKEVGAGNYALFLTADHAAAQVPQFLQDHKMPVNYLDDEALEGKMKAFVRDELGLEGSILSYSNQQVFLDHAMIDRASETEVMVMKRLANFISQLDGVASVVQARELNATNDPSSFESLGKMGWHPQRSGDLMVQYLPGWMDYPVGGTTHGSSYVYDTHVPLIFFGKGINAGVSYSYHSITQIASTICLLYDLPLPHTASPMVIEEVFKKD